MILSFRYVINPVLHDDCALLFHFYLWSHHTDVTWPEFLQSWKIFMFVSLTETSLYGAWLQAELSIKWHYKLYVMKENAWHYMMFVSFLNRLLSFVVLMLTEKCESILFVLLRVCLLLPQLYNSVWVLVCSIIPLHGFLTCAFCFQLFTPIFLKSSLTSSSHLNLGLPFGLVACGFHL